MSNEIYSTSRLNTASGCQYRYYLRYHKKTYPTVELSFFLVGNIVHKIIEDFYRSRICQSKFSKEEQLQWCSEKLFKSFGYKFGPFTDELKELSEAKREAIAATTAATGKEARPTATKLWKDIYAPGFAQSEQQLNDKVQAAFPNIVFFKPFTELFEQCNTCLNNFVEIHREAPDNPRAVIHEFRLDPPILVMGIKKGGRVDRIDMKVSDGGHVSYSVYDYKSGKAYWKKEDLKNNEQLCWYALALYETYGELPSTVGIMDLLHKQVIAGQITQEDIDAHLLRLGVQIEKVQALEATFTADESDIKFETPITRHESYNCKSCEYYYDKELRCKFIK